MADSDARHQPQSPVYVVALTGGIASGKTTVSNLFAELGVPVIDTDVIARELVEPGQPLLTSIIAVFGKELLDAYGRLKRRKLRLLIFKDKEKRTQLESIIHPEIAAEARRRISRIRSDYCILVIPLLAEKGGFEGVDRVLLVDTDAQTQMKRLTARDDVSLSQARAILGAQATREQRRAIANDVIENSGPGTGLRNKVLDLHKRYLSMCREHDPAATPDDSNAG